MALSFFSFLQESPLRLPPRALSSPGSWGYGCSAALLKDTEPNLRSFPNPKPAWTTSPELRHSIKHQGMASIGADLPYLSRCTSVSLQRWRRLAACLKLHLLGEDTVKQPPASQRVGTCASGQTPSCITS